MELQQQHGACTPPVVCCRGSTTVLILLIFYSAPLSVLAEVFRTHSSVALYLPFAVMNMVNGLLWSAYGLAVPDAFIYGPNLVRNLECKGKTAICTLDGHFLVYMLSG
eukprot:GHRR01028372.1.p2 GENE.GHRR01028372.1~~GHRR01028372.1.p2  ORF type:complete len:108 (+),score=15.07 GHRR01028372.1:1089-1412(+)